MGACRRIKAPYISIVDSACYKFNEVLKYSFVLPLPHSVPKWRRSRCLLQEYFPLEERAPKAEGKV